MAGYIRGITISFGADTSKLNGALKKTQGTINKTQAELKQINRALKFNPGNTTLLRQKFELLQQSVKETSLKLKQLKDMQRQMDAAGVDKTSAQYRELEREIVKTESQLKQAEGALKAFGSVGKQQVLAVGQAFQSAGAKIKSAGRTITTTFSVYGAAGIYAGAKLIDMSEQQAKAEQKLIAIYRNRMGVNKAAAQSTMELASALQKQGVIGDEVTLAGAQQLATFAKYPETINTILPAMDNWLAQEKGLSATQEDAEAKAKILGKALNGNVGALGRLGIKLTEAQQEILKTGTEEQKAAVIADALNSKFGDMNAELAKTDAGKIQQAKNELGDMGEEIGAVLLPAVADLVSWLQANLLPKLQTLITFLQQHPAIAKFALAFALITAALGPVLMIVGSFISMIGTIITIAPAVGAAFTAMTGPVGIVIAAIAAAVAIGVALYKNWDAIKAKAAAVWASVQNAVAVVVGRVKTNFNTLKTALSNVWNTIKTTASTVWNGIKTAITQPIQTAVGTIKGIINKIKGFFPISLKKLVSFSLPSISIGSKSTKVGDKSVKSPTFSVGSWHHYAKAVDQPYMFTRTTGMIAGEGTQNEIMYGHQSLMNDISRAANGGEVVARLAAIESILDYYLPKGQQIVMDNGVLIGQVNRGLGMRL